MPGETFLRRINDEKKDCTGCTACMNICPDKAIRMLRNEDGFWEPYADEKKCSGCGMCKKVCHLESHNLILNSDEPVYFAAFSKDRDNVEQSSSGGIFYEICKSIFNQSGIVYGAVQKSVYEVMHYRGITLEHAARFRRSKYLESNLDTSFKETEQDLIEGKKVLFSGVGCQIAGLYSYLQRDYENLYTCEVVCHGIPSYLVYRKYLAEKSRQCGAAICEINFRDKSLGWRGNSICECFESGRKDITLSNSHLLHVTYLKGMNMRKCCGFCQYAHIPRTADITLADFWQYKGKLAKKNTDTGISLIAVNNGKGRQLLREIEKSIYLEQVDKKYALESCRHMNHSPILHKNRPIFMKLIKKTSFHFAAEICTSFGAVIDESEVCKIQDVNPENILSVFWRDEREMIYILDKENKPQGIITCGNFIQNYMKEKEWVNSDFQKVVISEDCVEEIREIFEKYPVINRIPIIDQEGKLLFEVRREGIEPTSRLKDMLKSIKPFLQMGCRGIEMYFIKRPDLLQDYAYTAAEKEQIERELSFPVLSEDIETNEMLLRSLLKEKFSYTYLQELRKIPQIVEKNGRYQHIDQVSEYINVVNGCRKTFYQPKEYNHTIHMYGRCGVFGYAVEDADTMASALQHLLVKAGRKIRVVNHGLWGADNEKILHNLSLDIDEGVIKQNDQVVLYMDYLPYMEQIRNLNMHIYDSTCSFHKFIQNKTVFYDRPGHMTAEGYLYMADYIYGCMKQSERLQINKDERQDLYRFLSYAERTKEMDEKNGSYNGELEEYLFEIEKKISFNGDCNKNICQNKKTGAIVMNCNPFTKGHRYLIEESAKEVDILLIFVLEEEQSFFSFQDRFRMVEEGTKDLENVYVFPGGKFMISALTFPEYFIKEQIQEAIINPIMDVQIFAKQIAPRLHISVRFAGTEPEDKVTDQYNDTLREILPCYGIQFREVKRLEQGGRTVTATEVRKRIVEGENEGLKELIPKSTYDYLEERGFFGRKG